MDRMLFFALTTARIERDRAAQKVKELERMVESEHLGTGTRDHAPAVDGGAGSARHPASPVQEVR